jgi:hypothetical protein
MSEIEGTTPQGQPDSSGPATEGAPQETQAPVYGDQPALPEKFIGKSAEEIAQAYVELESKLGEQGAELAQYRRAPAPQYPYPPQAPGYPYGAPPPPRPPEPLKMNWENPVETIAQVVQQTIGPMVTNYQMNSAKSMGEIALSNAKAQDPAIFQGVESEVRTFVNNMVDQGVLRPDSALDPQTWRMAAWQMQGLKSGYKRMTSPINPVPVTRTETPGYRPPLAGPSGAPLTEADRRMNAAMGITEEQARKNALGRK